jgi:NDP-sugar pyrophosphorylase family protein
LSSPDGTPSAYLTSGYVNRLNDARDLRRLAVDAFLGRCAIRPRGREIKPGVWIDDGARVHRSARIVAPAYIGRGTRVRASALITRCSNVERRCLVDYGTAIEDSSMLPYTYVGRGLDLAHSVCDGSRLVNLARNVAVTVEDAKIIGRTVSGRLWLGYADKRAEAVRPSTAEVELVPVSLTQRQHPVLRMLSKGEV